MPTGRGVKISAAVSRGVGIPPSIEKLFLDAPGPDEVRVRVAACAVCHSDLSYLDGTWVTEFPMVLGHEAAGHVVEIGRNGQPGLSVGDPVVVSLVRTCGACRACRRGHHVACFGDLPIANQSPLSDDKGRRIPQGLGVGGFAEQVVVHRSQVVALPQDINLVAASLLGCGVLTGAGAVNNTARISTGDSVVVVGCGGVGNGAIQAARIVGANPIIAADPLKEKRNAALEFGATHAIDPVHQDMAGAITAATGGHLTDHLIVATGAPAALVGALDLLAPMGQLIIVGMAGDDVTMEVAPSWLASANKSILGSKMGTTHLAKDVTALIEHYQTGRLDLDGMVSSTHALERIAEAFDEAWQGEVLRTVVLPNGPVTPTNTMLDPKRGGG